MPLGLMLFQARNGHGHVVDQPAFLGGREFAEALQIPQTVASLEEAVFQSHALQTAYRSRGWGGHRAPVENQRGEDSQKAKKRQTLFFAYCSPFEPPAALSPFWRESLAISRRNKTHGRICGRANQPRGIS